MQKVKVSEYRRLSDRLFDLANKHYHACVGAKELESWQVSALSAFAEGTITQCARANAIDRQQFSDALKALSDRIDSVDLILEKQGATLH
mgnify:FL=1